MAKKIVILNGSPRPSGNKSHLHSGSAHINSKTVFFHPFIPHGLIFYCG